MFKDSLLSKIIIVFILIIIVILGSVAFITRKYTISIIEEKLEEESAIILQSLDWTLSNMLENHSDLESQRTIDNISSYELIKNIHVYDSECSVLFSSDFNDKNRLTMDSSIKELLENNKLRIIKEATSTSGLMMAVPIRGSRYNIDRGSDVIGAIMLELNDEYKMAMINSIQSQLLQLYIISSIGIIMFLGIILYVYIGTPLKRVGKAIEGITNRDYKNTYYFAKNAEFNKLSKVFEVMVNNIQAYNEELEVAKINAEEIGNSRIEFLANMSHEIRTPLNSIIGFTDILEENETNSEKKRKLKIIKKAGDHLLLLINDILDVSKIELAQVDLEHEMFSLKGLAIDIYKFYKPMTDKKEIDFLMKYNKKIPEYYIGDLHRIRQIISNLLNNAIKFTKTGSVRFENDYDETNGFLIIRIKDTGIGISEEKQKLVFEPFLQSDMSTTRIYGGTGLGLAICKRLVELMDGEIELISSINEGTEFIVRLKVEIAEHYSRAVDGGKMVINWLSYDTEINDIIITAITQLPEKIVTINNFVQDNDYEGLLGIIHGMVGLTGNLHMDELYLLSKNLNEVLQDEGLITEASETLVSELKEIVQKIPVKYFDQRSGNLVETHTKNTYRILLAEDIEENRELIALFLKNMDVELEFAENGLIALEKIYSQKFDLLLLDMQMPIMDGAEVISQLKQDGLINNIYIIALTANARKEDMDKYLAMGCNWFMSKPISKMLFREKINELKNNG